MTSPIQPSTNGTGPQPQQPRHAQPPQGAQWQQPAPQPARQPQPGYTQPNPQAGYAPQPQARYAQPNPQPQYAPQPGYAPTAPTPAGDPASQPIPGCDFPTAIKHYWTGYVRMRGRASRSEYWFSVLFNIIVSVALSALVSLFGDGLSFLAPIYSVATIIPTITITVRRLHDSDKSGLWLLLLYGLYVVGVIITVVGVGGAFAGALIGMGGYGDYSMLGGSVGLLVASLIIIVGTFIAQIVLMCLPSKESGRRFD